MKNAILFPPPAPEVNISGDWDHYQEDDDYARGVDDAMEDLDEKYDLM